MGGGMHSSNSRGAQVDFRNQEGQIGVREAQFRRRDTMMLDIRGICLW